MDGIRANRVFKIDVSDGSGNYFTEFAIVRTDKETQTLISGNLYTNGIYAPRTEVGSAGWIWDETNNWWGPYGVSTTIGHVSNIDPTGIDNDVLQINGTAGVLMPFGTTGERPSNVQNGTIRYNTTSNEMEFRINDAWVVLSSGSGTFVLRAGDTMTGDLAMDTTVQFLADPAAGASAPSYSFNLDDNTGMYTPSADELAFSLGGTQKLYLQTNDALFNNMTGGLLVPAGTTAQQPGSPVNGMIRYNSDNNEFEGYQSGAWAPIAGGSFLPLTGGTLTGGLIVDESSGDSEISIEANASQNASLIWRNTTPDPEAIAYWNDTGNFLRIASYDSATHSTEELYIEFTQGGNIRTKGTIEPTADNTDNIGSVTNGYATIYATTFDGTATQAQYADLAERYESDAIYEHGTVMVIGGIKEVTASQKYNDHSVIGVVSTNPALMMNSTAGTDNTHPYIALRGRVPCKVFGSIKKGDLLVTSNEIGYAASIDPEITNKFVFAKALEDNFEGKGLIEVLII